MQKILLIAFLAAGLFSGCATFEETVTYHPEDTEGLGEATNVRIKTTDGKVLVFKKVEVVKVENGVLFVKVWRDLKKEPEKLKFNLDETIIESDEFSPGNLAAFFVSTGILIGLIILIQILRE